MKENTEQPKDLTDDEMMPEEVEKAFAKLSPAERRNARALYAKYLLGETQRWQEEKLYKWGIIKIKVTENAGSGYDRNDECESQEALAIRMAQHYTNPDGSNQLNIKINKRSIGNWIKLKTAECAKNPPPGTCNDAGTRFSLKAWIAWFDKIMWPTKRANPAESKVGANINDEDLDVMEQREKREAIIHRRWERDQKKGEYVHRSVALATGIAAVKRLHLMVKQEDERNHPKLRREKLIEFGASPELVETFSAWDKEQSRQATDRREAEMQSFGFEFPKETT